VQAALRVVHSSIRPATVITAMPTTLNMRFALRLPANVNSIEPTAEAKTANDIDDILLRNVGKYDENIFTLSSGGAEGFKENTQVHRVQIKRGMHKRITPIIDSAL
jgi:hypothetical protein